MQSQLIKNFDPAQVIQKKATQVPHKENANPFEAA